MNNQKKISNLTSTLNKLTKAFISGNPITFNYRPEKSREVFQKPIVKILDFKVIKNSYLLISGINLNRISDINSSVSESVRSYRLDRMSNIKCF